MNETQDKENTTLDRKYILIFAILIFIIGGAILSYLFNKEKEEADIISTNSFTPTLSISPTTALTIIPTITPPQEAWETYTNPELGFSIKYPQMVYGAYVCSPVKPFYVPLKIFENNENKKIYLTEEYYYDRNTKKQTNNGPCEKITYSLELLLDEGENATFEEGTNRKPFLGWNIQMSPVKNNEEINKFIRDNYGSGCLMESKNTWKQQNGVYEIKLNEFKDAKGNNTDLGNAVCPVNYVYKILYAYKKNKIVSIKLGQECSFYTDPNSLSYKCYDEEILNNFEFK